MNHRKSVIAKLFFTIFAIAIVLFIFSNSAQVAEQSSLQSTRVMGVLNKALERLDFDFLLTEHIVRKTAHFLEYALLGFWLILTLRVYTRRVLRYIAIPLLACLLIPVVDETIQLFSYGRSASLGDVFLDFSGAVCGTVFALLLLGLFRLLGKRK